MPTQTSTSMRARASLLAERGRLLAELGEPIESPGQMTYGSQAAAATHVFEQQRDLALRDRSRTELHRVENALREAGRGHLRDVRELRQPDRAGAARGDPVGADVHRLRAQGSAVTAGDATAERGDRRRR